MAQIAVDSISSMIEVLAQSFSSIPLASVALFVKLDDYNYLI